MNKKMNLILREYETCTICPKKCGVNRLKNERGVCGVGRDSKVFNTTVLVNENEEIAPTYAIYFAGCSLDCSFCSVKEENELAKYTDGHRLNSTRLAQDKKTWMGTDFIKVDERFVEKVKKEIEEIKPKTISFIGGEPSAHLLTIFELIEKIKSEIPLVFYTNMYFQPKISRIINEFFEYVIVDIHFGNNECAETIAKGPEFFETVTRNITQLKNQILLRHLLLPGHLDCCYKKIIDWMAKKIPDKTLYLLTNYFPYVNTRIDTDNKTIHGLALKRRNAELARRVNADEIAEALDYAKNKGIIIKILDLLKPRPEMSSYLSLMQEVVIDEDGTVAFKYLDGLALDTALALTFCHSEFSPIANRRDEESQVEIASPPKKVAGRNDKSKKDLPR